MSTKNSGVKGKKDSKKSKIKHNLFLVFLGSVIGFINGFFGGGGGMLCVPALEKFCGLKKKEAHATAIAIIFPLSFVSSIFYIFNGLISSKPLICVGFGVLTGGILGSFLLKFLSEKVIGVIFSLLMIIAGLRLII